MSSAPPPRPLSKADKYNLKQKETSRLSSSANRRLRKKKALLLQRSGKSLSDSNVLTQAAVLFPPSPRQTTMTQGCRDHSYTTPAVSKEESLFSKPIPPESTLKSTSTLTSKPSKSSKSSKSSSKEESLFSNPIPESTLKSTSTSTSESSNPNPDFHNEDIDDDEDDDLIIFTKPFDVKNNKHTKTKNDRKRKGESNGKREKKKEKKEDNTTNEQPVVSPSKQPTPQFCNLCKAPTNKCHERLFGRHAYERARVLYRNDPCGTSLDDIKTAYTHAYKYSYEMHCLEKNGRFPEINFKVYKNLPVCMRNTSYNDVLKGFNTALTVEVNNELEDGLEYEEPVYGEGSTYSISYV